MSSTLVKVNGEKSPAQPIFSYAQAAKGRITSTATSVAPMHQSISSGSLATVRDENSVASISSLGSEREDRSATERFDPVGKIEASAEVTHSEVKVPHPEIVDSPFPSPGFVAVSVSSTCKDDEKDVEIVLVGNTSELSHERNTSGSSTLGKTNEGNADVHKGKKGKRQKNTGNDIDKEEVKPEVLVPAPLPAVNFWQQRKEKLARNQNNQNTLNTKAAADPPLINGSSQLNHKNIDQKKRGKQFGTENGDRNLGTYQNGGSREAHISGRNLKKGSNGPSRFKEDQPNKRNGARGFRQAEREEKASASQVPPPVEDANSWPTPETALEEDKRKVQEKMERDEKEENVSNKPRQKEKWVPVPYIPTVTFNTPMPTRGARARGGTRAGRNDAEVRSNHGQNYNITGEKSITCPSNNSNSPFPVDRHDTKECQNTTSAQPAKRHSCDMASTRNSSITQSIEKNRSNQSKNENNPSNECYHSSKTYQTGQSSEENRDVKAHPNEGFHAIKQDQIQMSEAVKVGTTGRRIEQNSRQADHSHVLKENQQSRERVDGRPDRGRGGFRGRGGHLNYSNGQSHQQSNFSNGISAQHQNGYNIRQGPYSPPLAPPFNAQFGQSSRTGRVGPRSQSIPNNGIYGRFSQNGASVSQPLTSIQTSAPMYDYVPIQPLSATPYHPYIDHVSVHAMVTMQLEYYFSIDNLCKDVYLRKHMDSQGFVFLSFIAGFKRIQALTQDFELLRFACQESEVIELVRGDDGIDRLRRKEGWEKWVLTMDERDESTKNSGPSFWHPPQYPQKSQYIGQIILTSPHPTCMMSYSASESSYPYNSKDSSVIPSLNGGDTYQLQTPLSAAVPDFAPGPVPIDNSTELLEAENTFHEDEIANLTLVFASPNGNTNGNSDSQTRNTFYHPSSRTFSNGSIDRRSITDGFCDDSHYGDRSLTNESQESETPPENYPCTKSSHSPLSPSRSVLSNGPPVMWVKGQRQQVPVTERNSQELYVTFRARALRNREISISTAADTHPDMKLLYEFWSHFLCRNFNSQMYSEFRRFALEDARAGSLNGMNNLISYYDEILNSKKKVIPEILARHYVDLVSVENSNERPAFERLRASWRNGALDLKSRKKIDSLVSPRLREELELAPNQKSDLL